MPGISEANLSNFRIVPIPETGELHLAWDSTSPEGQWFQVYRNQRLAWAGTQRFCEMPAVSADFTVVEIDANEAFQDFSADLTAPPGSGARADLTWYGGRYLIPTNHDLIGFNVYGEATPGGGINYSSPLAFIPATLGSLHVDGFGRGRFGRARFGYSEVAYGWRSQRLTAGTWNFGVKAVDSAGTEASVATTSVAITAPPGAPAPFSDLTRLHATWDSGTRVITLDWQAPL